MLKMKNNEKAIMAGADAILAYFFLQGNEKNKEKKINMSDVSIFPTEFYEK